MLQANSMSFPVLATPNFDTLSLGAIVANNVHGSNLKGRSFFASNVARATWVDGRGTVHTGGDLKTVSAGLGLTGGFHFILR